jgi:hypothetical protein
MKAEFIRNIEGSSMEEMSILKEDGIGSVEYNEPNHILTKKMTGSINGMNCSIRTDNLYGRPLHSLST